MVTGSEARNVPTVIYRTGPDPLADLRARGDRRRRRSASPGRADRADAGGEAIEARHPVVRLRNHRTGFGRHRSAALGGTRLPAAVHTEPALQGFDTRSPSGRPGGPGCGLLGVDATAGERVGLAAGDSRLAVRIVSSS